MFNLENQIAAWRKQMMSGGVTNPDLLDELESHLREDIEEEVASGLTEELAFQRAAERIGQANALQNEFKKFGKSERKIARAVLAFAGIGNQAFMPMNTTANPSIERPWITYLKTATWLLPCLTLWAISTVFIFPKLKQIWSEANFNQSLFRFGMRASDFYIDYGVLILVGAIVTMVFFEWRWTAWPRYRKAFLGFGVFLLNSAVLILIWLMLVSALIAAPALFHLEKRSAPPASTVEK